MSKVTYLGRGEKLPRNKHGDKPGHFPARPAQDHKRGMFVSPKRSRIVSGTVVPCLNFRVKPCLVNGVRIDKVFTTVKMVPVGYVQSNPSPDHSGSFWGFAPRSQHERAPKPTPATGRKGRISLTTGREVVKPNKYWP